MLRSSLAISDSPLTYVVCVIQEQKRWLSWPQKRQKVQKRPERSDHSWIYPSNMKYISFNVALLLNGLCCVVFSSWIDIFLCERENVTSTQNKKRQVVTILGTSCANTICKTNINHMQNDKIVYWLNMFYQEHKVSWKRKRKSFWCFLQNVSNT